jgi:hypothetical protein
MTRARGCLFCRTGMLIGVFPLGLAAQELPVNHELQQHVALVFILLWETMAPRMLRVSLICP